MTGTRSGVRVGNVNPETLTRKAAGTHARIRVRVGHFLRCMSALGCDSDVSRSRLIDVDPRTLYNARQGKAISGDFVARTLNAFRARGAELDEAGLATTFDDLFEVVRPAERAA